MFVVSMLQERNKRLFTFVIIDASQMPFIVVAKYRDNEIKPLLFPHRIQQVCHSIQPCTCIN